MINYPSIVVRGITLHLSVMLLLWIDTTMKISSINSAIEGNVAQHKFDVHLFATAYHRQCECFVTLEYPAYCSCQSQT